MATLLKVDKDVAVLRLRGGRIYPYPIINLSEESKAMLKKKDNVSFKLRSFSCKFMFAISPLANNSFAQQPASYFFWKAYK